MSGGKRAGLVWGCWTTNTPATLPHCFTRPVSLITPEFAHTQAGLSPELWEPQNYEVHFKEELVRHKGAYGQKACSLWRLRPDILWRVFLVLKYIVGPACRSGGDVHGGSQCDQQVAKCALGANQYTLDQV